MIIASLCVEDTSLTLYKMKDLDNETFYLLHFLDLPTSEVEDIIFPESDYAKALYTIGVWLCADLSAGEYHSYAEELMKNIKNTKFKFC